MNGFELPADREKLLHSLRHQGRSQYGLRGIIYFSAAAILSHPRKPDHEFRVAALLNNLGRIPDRIVLEELRSIAGGQLRRDEFSGILR